MAITDPRDIPGLRVWYSAEAETGYADGAIISTLTDLSGNGHHASAYTVYASPQWMATGGPSGGAYIRTQGTPTANGSGFDIPTAAFSGLTSGTAAIYLDPVDSGNGAHWDLGSDFNSSHYPFSSTTYDDFGTAGRKSFANYSRAWHRYRASSAPGQWTAWADGIQQHTTTSNTVGWATTPRIAFSRPGSTNYTLNGFTTFVLYDHVLTSTEAADLEAWMAAHPSGGTTSAPSGATGTLAAVLPPLSGSLAGAYGPSGSIAASLPTLSADLSGETYPPGVAGDLTAVLPSLTGAFAGTSEAPSTTGTLAATLPSLSAHLMGQSFGTGTEGYLEAVLPALSASLTGDVLGRNGFGLTLDSSASLTVNAALEPEPSIPAGTPSTVLHIVAPTVPVPTLVAGRLQ